MEPHKHGYIFRETDIDRTITRFGNKPPQALKDQMMASLRKERGKFRRLYEMRGQSVDNQRGQSI